MKWLAYTNTLQHNHFTCQKYEKLKITRIKAKKAPCENSRVCEKGAKEVAKMYFYMVKTMIFHNYSFYLLAHAHTHTHKKEKSCCTMQNSVKIPNKQKTMKEKFLK